MKQLSSQEFQIYKRHVLEQIANAYNKIGTLDIECLDKVVGLEYEISDVTNLIYPKIKFYDTFEELQTLSKIEQHNKPNDLLEKYNSLLAENGKLSNALPKIINNLSDSGAWTGGLEGNFNNGRNIATGKINLFSSVTDGEYFIRTNNRQSENDLAGGV